MNSNDKKRTQLNIRLERATPRRIIYRTSTIYQQGGLWKEIDFKTGKVKVVGKAV